MIKRYLLAPGPTPVPPEVLQSMALPIIHHRSADFVPVIESAKKGLKKLFQTKNDVLILSASGTGAMVAAVNNFFSPGDKVLVVNGGKFGERWTRISRSHGLKVKEIKVRWGYAVKPSEVDSELRRDRKIKAVMVQASETSTGVYHDIKSLGSVMRKHRGVLFIVDAISGLVAHDIKPDAWGVDIMVAGSQKGLMMPPGLAFISVSERAWKANAKARAPRFYFDLKKERESLSKNQTNFTSSVTLIIALNEALKLIEQEGLRNVFKRHKRLAVATRAAVKALGLELFAKESPSNALTAVEAPKDIDGQKIYSTLRDSYGITGAGGQDKARGKIFRIAHLGYADTFDVITAIAGLEMVLRKLGYDVKLGTGVAAAQKLLMVR